MTTLIIACMTAAALYCGKRWNDAHAENLDLREQVAALKRQLARRR